MRILVAGNSGLVGSALMRHFTDRELNVVGINSSDVDLTDREATLKWFRGNKFDVVIDSAAKVGGILANNDNPVEFLIHNLTIQNNLMEASYENKVRKFVFLGSSCIYPRDAIQPIKEDSLLTGKLEPTNSAYAIAKIAGLELVKSYRREYGLSWISLMPTNIYGPGDNFALNSSHVLPALIRKISDAKKSDASEVILWGTGKPMREFLYSDDLASAVYFTLERYDEIDPINIGTGQEISINKLANLISKILGFKGKICWDISKPDGNPRKLLDTSRIHDLGWKHVVSLEVGIQETVKWFESAKNRGQVRL